MRLLQSMSVATLGLLTIGTAMAQTPAAAPVAPAKAVPLDEAVRGLVEKCTDHVLGTLAQPSPRYNIPTTEGVIFISAPPGGACRITSGTVNPWVFDGAFNAAFHGSTRYVRDSRGPTLPNKMSWRSEKVVATTSLAESPGRNFLGIVRISRVLE